MNVPWSFIVFTYLVYPCSLVPCIDQTFIGSTDLVIEQVEKIVVLILVPVDIGVSCLALCMLVFRI